MLQELVNFYQKTRPHLNNLREKKLCNKTQFTGTINQLLEKLKNHDTIRYIGLITNSNHTTTMLDLKEKILHELHEYEKDLNFNQIYDFNCSVYKGKRNETIYADLELNLVNSHEPDHLLKKYIILKATKMRKVS